VAYLAAHSYDFSVGNLSGQLTKLKKDKSFQCVEWHNYNNNNKVNKV